MVSGPSGVGKGTVIAELRRRRPELGMSVSWTTRAMRPGEQDGVHYRFVTEERFRTAIDEDAFVEWEEYRGARYGTPWSEIERAAGDGRDVILEIDVRGAMSIKELFPHALTVFVEPPTVSDLERRLRGRATDTPEQIAARLEAARTELGYRDRFDHTVLNDEVSAAVDRLEAILDA
ncbi:MAG TPA: guanylate kinase [Actinomycetota bacterium]|nr:guanylate kinase [Actinomycetota bacterium]